MSFTGLKHITYKEAILSIHMGLSQYRKESVPHIDDGPTKSYRMGFGKLDQHSAKATFLHWKKYRSIPIYLKN
jgi:hypothetical protein